MCILNYIPLYMSKKSIDLFLLQLLILYSIWIQHMDPDLYNI